MKILFSPVGMTDPMTKANDESKEYHDGALLHICRHEQPDIVCIYMSKETLELDALDSRYSKSMELMQAYLQERGKELKIERVERPDLVEVQKFDSFIQDFKEILTKYRMDYPDAEILVNVSSGTPAMKSTLQNLASSSRFLNLKPMQVSTPRDSANYKNKETRNVAEEWNANLDHQENAAVRVSASRNTNLTYEFNKKLLISLIENYDYKAAKLTYETTVNIERSLDAAISPEFRTLLDAAIDRINLKPEKAAERINELGFEKLIDTKTDLTAEYFLLLDLYIKKQNYTDYLRAITPFVLELFYHATEKQCGIKLADYTQGDNRYLWDADKLNGSKLDGKFHQKPYYHDGEKRYCNSYLNGIRVNFPQDYMLSWQLLNLCENLSHDKEFIRRMIEIRTFELKIRNLAAHTIRSFTESEIKRETTYTPKEMHDYVFRFIRSFTDLPITKDSLSQYDRMNEKLISLL